MFGVNSAGLSSKLKSFDYLLSSLQPSIFFIQESKMKTQGKIKDLLSFSSGLFTVLVTGKQITGKTARKRYLILPTTMYLTLQKNHLTTI